MSVLPGKDSLTTTIHPVLEATMISVGCADDVASDPLNSDKTILIARIAMVFAGAIGTVLLLGSFNVPDGWDKLAHGAMFYGLTLLALAALPSNRKEDIALAVVAIAAASEVAQYFAGRDMSLADWLVDTVGVFVATAPVYVGRMRHLAQRARRDAHRERRKSGLTVVRTDVGTDVRSLTPTIEILQDHRARR